MKDKEKKEKKENTKNVSSLHEKLKVLQTADLETLKELKIALVAELDVEILTRKQQIDLIDRLIKNKEK